MMVLEQVAQRGSILESNWTNPKQPTLNSVLLLLLAEDWMGWPPNFSPDLNASGFYENTMVIKEKSKKSVLCYTRMVKRYILEYVPY